MVVVLVLVVVVVVLVVVAYSGEVGSLCKSRM